MEEGKSEEISRGVNPGAGITGLYFGSFNPVHIGHLAIANYLLEFAGLREIWFVVSPQNPLKQKDSLLADHHRYAMVEIATSDFPRFRPCNIEFRLPRPSYTIHTLTALAEKYPTRRFALIMGSDNLGSLHVWKNYQEILSGYTVVVYPRPGHSGGGLANHPSVQITSAPMIEISSSFIRTAISQKKDVRFFMPEKVFRYVDEMNFYK